MDKRPSLLSGFADAIFTCPFGLGQRELWQWWLGRCRAAGFATTRAGDVLQRTISGTLRYAGALALVMVRHRLSIDRQ